VTTLGIEEKWSAAAVFGALLLVVGCGGGGSKPANVIVDAGADAALDAVADTGPLDVRTDAGIETIPDTRDAAPAPVDATDGASADATDAGAGDVGPGDSADGSSDGPDGGGRPAIMVVATYLGGISSFRIAPTSGELLPATSSLDLGAQLYAVAAHPTGDFVYATDFRGRIYSYRVNRDDGSLADLSASPLVIGGQAISAAIDPQGRFLYVGNSGDSSLYVFAIDPTSGALNPITGSPFLLATAPAGLCFHPSGQFLFLSSVGIHVFKIDPTSGAPKETEHSPFATTIFGGALVMHPNGNFLYDGAFGVHVLSVDPASGDLGELGDSPHAGAQSDNLAIDVAVDPLGQFLYAVSSEGKLTAYRLGVNGAFGPVDTSPFDAHTLPYSVAVDPTGRFVYVGNDDVDQLSAFSIERTTGDLQPVMNSPFTAHGLQPEMVIIGP
jgi:6-phosphogluconolactonase (cycloisomerase 2 family)